ncbi:MAG: FitA-like ribbon-helix-helix domain-containing protein [Ilumatobacteraceae bacterium]
MPAITIRDVPQDTRDELAKRAALKGQSLQEYLRAQLIALADRMDKATVLAQIRERVRLSDSTVTVEDILAARDAERR